VISGIAYIHAGVNMANQRKSTYAARLDPVFSAVVDDHPIPIVPATPDPARVQSTIAGRSEFTKRRKHRRPRAGRFEAPSQTLSYGNRAVTESVVDQLRQVDTLPRLSENSKAFSDSPEWPRHGKQIQHGALSVGDGHPEAFVDPERLQSQTGLTASQGGLTMSSFSRWIWNGLSADIRP
jgi:hypothetical protein